MKYIFKQNLFSLTFILFATALFGMEEPILNDTNPIAPYRQHYPLSLLGQSLISIAQDEVNFPNEPLTHLIASQTMPLDTIEQAREVRAILSEPFKAWKTIASKILSPDIKTDLIKYFIALHDKKTKNMSVYETLQSWHQLIAVPQQKQQPEAIEEEEEMEDQPSGILEEAARYGYLSLIKLLLRYSPQALNAEVENITKKLQYTSLPPCEIAQLITKKDNLEALKALIVTTRKEHEGSLSALNDLFEQEGTSALLGAFFNNQSRIIDYLESLGINKQKTLNQIWTEAIIENDLKTIKDMLALGYDINAIDNSTNTALHLAAADLNYELINFLLINKAHAMVLNEQQETPLVTALYSWLMFINPKGTYTPDLTDAYKIIESLLHHGVDPTISDKQGYTALDYAESLLEHDKENAELIQSIINLLTEQPPISSLPENEKNRKEIA